MTYHITVLPNEVLKYLSPKPGEWYLDATLGDAGHTKLILETGANVWGIDQDEDAIKRTHSRLGDIPHSRLRITRGNFSELLELHQSEKLPQLDGALFDLGASTLQLTSPVRGFSFMGEAPLDMRMDQRLGATAADLVNALSEKELTQLFKELGGETHARVIAREIVKTRLKNRFTTTKQLADLISRIKPRFGKLHPATKVFQALRMAVNAERHSLRKGLEAALAVMKPGGRLAIISFHEGEDAIVKHWLTSLVDTQLKILTSKPVVPTPEEVDQNPRARSAKLRVAIKI